MADRCLARLFAFVKEFEPSVTNEVVRGRRVSVRRASNYEGGKMKTVRIATLFILLVVSGALMNGAPCLGCGSCLNQLNTDTIDCDQYYSTGPGGVATPWAHAGCIADATTRYYECVWNSAFN